MQKKYEKVIAWIKSQIESGALAQGNRLPSENLLMEQFQVSRQTVRRALEILTEEGVVEGRRGSGTYVSVNTRRYTGKEIRVEVMLTCVDTYIFPALVRGIESVLSGEGCTMQISVTGNAVEKERMLLKELIRTKSVDGLIAEPVKSGLPNPNLELYLKLERMGIPVLFVNSFYRELDIPHVSLDDRQAGYLAARHLAECGHTRIGGIFKSDDGQGHLRYAGYTEALMEREIRVRSEHVIWIDSDELREMEEERAKFLKRLKGCTACVCYNDETAYKLVSILREAGVRVPGDVSVVGIDNSGLAGFCPVPLTSVRNPAEKLGKAAAERMVGCICRQEKMETLEFEPELIMRSSVKVLREI